MHAKLSGYNVTWATGNLRYHTAKWTSWQVPWPFPSVKSTTRSHGYQKSLRVVALLHVEKGLPEKIPFAGEKVTHKVLRLWWEIKLKQVPNKFIRKLVVWCVIYSSTAVELRGRKFLDRKSTEWKMGKIKQKNVNYKTSK